MTKQEFIKMIKPMMEVFIPIADSALEVYYSKLKNTDVKIFKLVVDELINTHKEGWFPKIAEFQEVITEVANRVSLGEQPVFNPTKCRKCNDTGLVSKEVWPKGTKYPYYPHRPCDCLMGKKWKPVFERLEKEEMK